MLREFRILFNIFESEFLKQLEFNQDYSKVFVFTVNIANYANSVFQFWECLSELEKMQANKYYTTDLTKRYIISHGILRYILGYYIKQNPRDIKFIFNKYGKPFVKNNNIQFNMSHSHNIISYIVALNYKVGIDIELHDNKVNIQELSNLVFTSTEDEFFSTLITNKKLKFFYDLWTKKESLIKAIGQGLSYPINTIEAMALLSGDKIFLNYRNNESKQEWYCFPLELTSNYSGAIAVEYKVKQIIYIEIKNNQDNNVLNFYL